MVSVDLVCPSALPLVQLVSDHVEIEWKCC